MSRPAVWLVLVLFLGLSFGCGHRNAASLPSQPKGLAVVTVADGERQRLPPGEGEILLQVMNWLERDIGRRLRDRGFEVTLLRDTKGYTPAMGSLLVMDIVSFEPGMAVHIPHRQPSEVPSALIVRYRFLDPRGVSLAQWQDGAESIKGGTYCARTLNLRAVARIAASFQEP